AADAAGLHAAERGRQVADVLGVDPDHASVELAREAVRPGDVAGPEVGGEAVVDVVGDGQRLGLVVEGQRDQHGPEDLLPGDAHGPGGSGEQRGAHVAAFRGAARGQPGALLLAALEVAAHLGYVLG